MGVFGAFGLSFNSKAKQKQPPTNILQLATAVQSGKPVEVAYFSIKPTEGWIPHPVVKLNDSTYAQADWYRFGLLSSNQDEAAQGLFSVPPRKLDDFPDDLASIRVIGTKNGKEIDLVPAYSKFIIESVQESYAERMQIVETFGDFYIFFFGSRPSQFTFTGTLINAKNANWLADFMMYYDNFLRGTKCVENDASLIVTYGGRQVEGFMTGCSNVTTAASEKGVGLSFQVVITDRKSIGYSDDAAYSITNQGQLIKDTNWAKMLNQIAGIEGTGTSSTNSSDSISAVTSALNGLGPSTGVDAKAAIGPLAAPF